MSTEKTYQASQIESSIQELWERENIFNPNSSHYTAHKAVFSIDTPPPTVSGALHIGHVFSYTQADIIARYQRLTGKKVLYPFGFDDNGLATERFVEKKCNTSAALLGRSAFIELCLKETACTEKEFELLWRRLGLSIDWSKCYSTISKCTRKISQKSFIELLKKNFIYRKEEPALYCTTCRTSVAQAELDDTDRPSLLTEVIFTSDAGEQLVIATTRPELLSSCVALFYHPKDSRYQHLRNNQARVPLYNYLVPILPDERVIPDKGTGLVMSCTFGDKTDIEWYKAHKLPYRPSIGRDGRMTEISTFLAGKKVAEARTAILEKLKESELIRSQKAITHTVNIHERCKQDIEYLALNQWFLKLLPYKDIFLELANKITWHPKHMKSRYDDWVRNLSWDWCLSRQRFYGIPFPVWYCLTCNAVLLPNEADLPVDPQEQQYFTNCPHCSSTTITPDTDVMDTWNTSSLTPYILQELYTTPESKLLTIPLSMRPQAHDIIRTWAFYTIIKTWMHEQKIPWETIMISGHVLTAGGDKISKSQANSPLIPENLLKLYPADAIRYWTAKATLGQDTAFSDTQLKQGQRLITKLWNAFRFIQEHSKDILITKDLFATTITGIANQWILAQAHETYKKYSSSLDQYLFNEALEQLEQLFWHDYCDNYLELSKDILFNPDKYSPQQVRSTQITLWVTGLKLLQLYSPFIPHVTEALYQELYRTNVNTASLALVLFDTAQALYTTILPPKNMHSILELVKQARKLKSEHQLSLKTDIDLVTITLDKNLDKTLEEVLNQESVLIKGITRAQSIAIIRENLTDRAIQPQLITHDNVHDLVLVLKDI